MITIALSVINDCLICIELYDFYLNHSSFYLWGKYALKHTQLLANHSSECLLLSLQSSTTIQTEHSDEGGQKQDLEKSLLLLNYDVVDVKNFLTL